MRMQSIAIESQSGNACCAGRRRRLRMGLSFPGASACRVVNAAPEIASGAVPEAHNATAFGADGGIFIDGAALSALFFDPCGSHAFGEAALFDEPLAMLFEKPVEHVQGSTNENEHGVCEDDTAACGGVPRSGHCPIAIDGYRLLSIFPEPLSEFLSLCDDVLGEIVVDVGSVIGGIKPNGVNGTGFGGGLRPRRQISVEQPGEIVVTQFAEACLGDIDEFQGRLHRSGEPFASFGEVLYSRACSLGHLVELPSARIVAERKETSAEHKRFKLDDIHQDISVEPLVAGGVFEDFSHGGDCIKAKGRKARRLT